MHVNGEVMNLSSLENDTSLLYDKLLQPRYISAYMIATSSLILAVGLSGNVTVILLILKDMLPNRSHNVYLLSLSIADMLVLLICLPVGIIDTFGRTGAWYFGNFMCGAVVYLENVAITCSALTMLAISVSRYKMVMRKRTQRHQTIGKPSKTVTVLIVVCLWLVSLLSCSPYPFMLVFRLENGEAVCLKDALSGWKRVFYVTNIVLFFFIPFLFMLFAYSKIMTRLNSYTPTQFLARATRRKSSRKPEDQPHTEHLALLVLPIVSAVSEICALANRSDLVVKPSPSRASGGSVSYYNQKAIWQVTVMSFSILLAFFMCVLPVQILFVLVVMNSDMYIRLQQDYPDVIRNIFGACRLLIYVSSACNPIIYNISSRDFRSAFAKLYGCDAT